MLQHNLQEHVMQDKPNHDKRVFHVIMRACEVKVRNLIVYLFFVLGRE